MAKNKKQSRGLLSFLLWLLLMSILIVSAARGEDRALLIGVGRYAGITARLNGVSLDISMMSEVAELLGFTGHEIKVLEQEAASTARVYETIEEWLVKGAGPDDRVLFYFSGHGSQIPDENNDEKDQFDEVLLLYDVALTEKRGQQTLTGVLVDDHFNHMLGRMKSRNVLVILDACHSGSATRSLGLTPRSIPVNEAKVKYFYYSPMLEAAGRAGVQVMPLFQDDRESVRLEHWDAGADIDLMPDGGIEIFVLEGSFEESGENFEPQSWLRLPIGTELEAKAGSEGCKCWIKEGHLRFVDLSKLTG